jgi:hypothetical protein
MTGTMQMKMPANSFATSVIGRPVEAVRLPVFPARYGQRHQGQHQDDGITHQVLQLERHALDGRLTPGFHVADSRMAAITPASSGMLAQAADAHLGVRRRDP